MFSQMGLIGLIVYLLVRPFYFVPLLSELPLVHVLFGLTVIGFVLDLVLGQVRWVPGPHLPWVLGLAVWIVGSVLVHSPAELGEQVTLVISIGLYFVLAHGLTDFPRLGRVAGALLACTVVVSAVCVYQGLRPLQCVAIPDDVPVTMAAGEPDGRTCSSAQDCYEDVSDFEVRYLCEHVGPGKMHSTMRRVRYLGVLEDPNEASLAASLGIPLAIARYQQRRRPWRLVQLCLTVVLACLTVIMAQSRSGQLVFGLVLGSYFVARYRWKGLALASLLALPVLILGGRSGAEATESTDSRLSLQQDGVYMFLAHPLLGVGHGQYERYTDGTAHNSFVLAPAELGLVGMALWAMVFWISWKVVWVGLRAEPGPDPAQADSWGRALLAVLIGLAGGVCFLTLNYHHLVWIVFGLSGAYYRTLLEQQPGLRVQVGIRDLVLVVLGNLTLLAVVYLYVRIRG